MTAPTDWETFPKQACGHEWRNINGDVVTCDLIEAHQYAHRGTLEDASYSIDISPAQHDLRANLCESCHFRHATVFVRFFDDPAPAFRVCDPCSHEAEGLMATVLGVVS